MPKSASKVKCLDFNPRNGFLTIRRACNCKFFVLKMFSRSKGSILHFIVNCAQSKVGWIYGTMSKTPFLEQHWYYWKYKGHYFMQKVPKCDEKYTLKISSNLLHKQKSWNFEVDFQTNMAKSSFLMRASTFLPIDLKPSLYKS